MRKLSFFFVFISNLGFSIFLTSCINSTNQQNNNSLSENVDTVGYYAARNLHGLAKFIIEKSTYKETLQQIESELKSNEKYWYGPTVKEVQYDTVRSFLERDLTGRKKFGCPDLEIMNVVSFFIGDIELKDLELYFFEDTLFKIKCWQNDDVEAGFKEKYGDGRFFDQNLWQTPFGEKNKRPDNDEVLKKSELLKIDEKRIWENPNIVATSQTYVEYKYDGDKCLGAEYSNSFFEISSKDPVLKNKIEMCEKNAESVRKRLIDAKKQKDINAL